MRELVLFSGEVRVLVSRGLQRTASHTFLEDDEKMLPFSSAVETSDGNQRGAVEEQQPHPALTGTPCQGQVPYLLGFSFPICTLRTGFLDWEGLQGSSERGERKREYKENKLGP